MGNVLNHLPDSKRVPRQKDKINKFFFSIFRYDFTVRWLGNNNLSIKNNIFLVYCWKLLWRLASFSICHILCGHFVGVSKCLFINLKQWGIWIWFLFSLYDWTRPPSSFSCCFPKQKPASLHARGVAEGSKKGRYFRLLCNFVNPSLIGPIIKVIPKFLTNVK